MVLNSCALLIGYPWSHQLGCCLTYLKFPFPALKQILTAARGGWAARASSWRNTCTKWSTTCPAARAPTPEKLPTALLRSMIGSRGKTSAGRMRVAPRKSWRSTSPRPGTASAPCCPWKARRWQHSTAATMTTCSWSPGAKGQGPPTSSASSSQQSSITKWTSCLGSYAKGTGAATTKPGLPTMGRSAQKTRQMKTTTSSFKKQGNTEKVFLFFRRKIAFVSWMPKNWWWLLHRLLDRGRSVSFLMNVYSCNIIRKYFS